MKPGTHLFVLPWDLDHPGGVNEVVRSLRKSLEERGRLRPAVLTMHWPSVRPDIRASEGRTTILLRLRPPLDPRRPLRSFLTFLLFLPASLWRLRKLFRDESVKVVNPHYPDLASWNFVLLRRLGLWRGKLLLSGHGDDVQNAARTTGWARFLWRGLYRAADAIITPSGQFQQEVRAIDPRLEDTLRVVHNGVDAARLSRIAASADAVLPPELAGRRLVVSVASLFEPRKAQDVTIRAFARVAAARPDAALALVAAGGPWSGRVAEMIAEAGLADRAYRYEGIPHPRVIALMRDASVLVLPSRYESFGLVLLEAGVFGVPSIAARVGGVPEVVEDGVSGLLIDPEDADALAERVLRLLDDEAERRRLGAGMRRAVEERFTWDEARRKYESIAGQ